jgi:SOS-response transcriptional repressor LexA
MDRLSDLQKRILDHIGAFIKMRGRAPSLREISRFTGLSKSSSQYHVGRLCRLEFICRKRYARNILILWRKSPPGPHSSDPSLVEHISGVVLERAEAPLYLAVEFQPGILFEMDDDFLFSRGIRKYDHIVVTRAVLPSTGNYVVIKIYGKFFLRIYSAVSHPKRRRLINHVWYNPLDMPEAELIGKVMFFERSFP